MPREFNILDLIGKMSIKYSNLPERYIKRVAERVYYRTPRKPNYLPRTDQKKNFVFSVNRPWTEEFQMENLKYNPRKIPIEPLRRWSFFAGDKVEILTGRDKGKQGLVSQIFEERNWVTVKGLNTEIIMMGKSDTFGGFPALKEKPLLVTEDIALVDPYDLKGTQVEWRFTEDGDEVRVSKRTGRVIPIPASDKETIDYKAPNLYIAGAKDTTKDEVEKVTFKPCLKTFEMDVMDKMGIKEDRVPQKMYWY